MMPQPRSSSLLLHAAGAALAGFCLLAAAHAETRRTPIGEWFPRLRKGMWVKVEGRLQENRGLRASEIKVLNGDLDEVEITSVVTSIDPVQKTLRVRTGILVTTDLKTEIQVRKKTRATFSSLQVGDRIEAEGLQQRDGSLLADEIEVKKPEQPARITEDAGEDEVTARIESLDPVAHKIVLLGMPVYLDERTKNKTPLFE